MAIQVQCDNCGAVLLEEDAFCGECGAPRPGATGSAEPAEVEQATAAEPTAESRPRVPSTPAPAQPRPSTEAGWRAAFITLMVLGAIACLAGIAAFLFFGSVRGETTTVEEDWLFSALCCLLPISGTGALLTAVGGILWYTRLREP